METNEPVRRAALALTLMALRAPPAGPGALRLRMHAAGLALHLMHPDD